MTTVTGKVKGGVVIFDGAPPAEGASVTVVFDDDDEPYRLSADEAAAVEEAEADMDAGHAIPAADVLNEMRQRG